VVSINVECNAFDIGCHLKIRTSLARPSSITALSTIARCVVLWWHIENCRMMWYELEILCCDTGLSSGSMSFNIVLYLHGSKETGCEVVLRWYRHLTKWARKCTFHIGR
jgi:hypothetical protein